MAFSMIPSVDDVTHEFPAPVKDAIANMAEMEDKYVRDDEGVYKVGTDPIVFPDPSPTAALDTVGWARAVFIEEGGTVPVGTPAYTLVVELETA